MANFTAADVKKLRELTQAGMMDCKKALTEADGDFDKAVELLRVKGAAKAAARGAERETAAGLVATSGNALVELKSETDFVAKNEDFIAKAQARAGEREATAGLVATAGGALIELNSETDFVAKSEEFVAAANEIAAARAAASSPSNSTSTPTAGGRSAARLCM